MVKGIDTAYTGMVNEMASLDILQIVRQNHAHTDALRVLKAYAGEQGMTCYISTEVTDGMAGFGACLGSRVRTSKKEKDAHSNVKNKRNL